MSHPRFAPFSAVGWAGLFLASAVGIAAAAEPEPAPAPAPMPAPAPAPATLPAGVHLPKADQVPALDDAKLYGLFLLLYPDFSEIGSSLASDDPQQPLIQAIWSEANRRAGARLKSFLAGERQQTPDELGEPGFFLVLNGVRYASHESPDAEDASAHRKQTERIVRQAIARGGKLRDFALGQFRLDDVAWMTDTQLQECLPRVHKSASSWQEQGRNRERILCEIVRRRGPGWEKVLTTELRQIEQMNNNGPLNNVYTFGFLETLTALRRLEGKPDPLQIEVAWPAKLESVFPALPERVEASLVNLDSDPFPIQQGGDYRSGRQARWRIEARDAAGKLLPEREVLGFDGGGLYRVAEVAPGEKWKTRLDVGNFLPALPPGEYTLRILYHDGLCIADETNVDGLIVSSSPTLKLTVKPLEIPEAKVDAAKIRDLLAGIDEKAKLKVVGGTYGNWAYDLVPPDSPQGKLLAIGIPAVPTLLEALDNPKLKPKRRAIVLCLLYSLTGQNDPTHGGPILGPYNKSDGPWSVVQDGGGGLGWGGGEDSPQGDLDSAKQIEFARCWSVWKQYVRIMPPGK
jgi:hypothetical protein